MEKQYSIEVSQLTKNFGQKCAVNGVDISIPRGVVCGFLGPNGSGKTTILRMLCGLLTPTAGHGTCLGYDIITESMQIKKIVGYMPQQFSLYNRLTVLENLTFIARLYNMPDRNNKVAAVIEEMGLQHYKNHLANALSGGYKQRLSLAAAIVHEPKILLLDEPTAGVDPHSRQEIWDKLQQFAKSDITVLVSTHYMDEAERCHYLTYLAYGQLIAAGTVQAVIDHCGLTTWLALGNNVMCLAEKLKQIPAIDQVIERGNELRVSNKNALILEEAIKPYLNENYTWRPVRTTLEDVFIYMMKSRQDTR